MGGTISHHLCQRHHHAYVDPARHRRPQRTDQRRLFPLPRAERQRRYREIHRHSRRGALSLRLSRTGIRHIPLLDRLARSICEVISNRCFGRIIGNPYVIGLGRPRLKDDETATGFPSFRKPTPSSDRDRTARAGYSHPSRRLSPIVQLAFRPRLFSTVTKSSWFDIFLINPFPKEIGEFFMFGTVLRQTLPGLSTSRWNQNRSGKHREQEICCLVQENPSVGIHPMLGKLPNPSTRKT